MSCVLNTQGPKEREAGGHIHTLHKDTDKVDTMNQVKQRLNAKLLRHFY